jgi:cobalt-zinc-cadmium efflux system protein
MHDHTHGHDDHPSHDHGHSHAHAHGHAHGHGHYGDSSRAITRAMAVTIFFMAIEAAGGWYSNSLALTSDAAHMLSDVGAMLLSLFAIWVSARPSTPKMSFGYHRAEILGALASGLAIWLISGFLIYGAVMRMNEPPEVKGPVVFIIAVIGLGANLFSMLLLHKTKDSNMNVRGAYLHLLSDSLGSVGAIIAGAVLWWTDWRPIDPIITLLFTGLMLVTSWSLVRDAVAVLMESSPPGVDPGQVLTDLRALTHVTDVHDLHIWTVSSGRLALSVHLIAQEPGGLLQAAHAMLQERHKIIHTTIQIEHPDRFQSERCYDCG